MYTSNDGHRMQVINLQKVCQKAVLCYVWCLISNNSYYYYEGLQFEELFTVAVSTVHMSGKSRAGSTYMSLGGGGGGGGGKDRG